MFKRKLVRLNCMYFVLGFLCDIIWNPCKRCPIANVFFTCTHWYAALAASLHHDLSIRGLARGLPHRQHHHCHVTAMAALAKVVSLLLKRLQCCKARVFYLKHLQRSQSCHCFWTTHSSSGLTLLAHQKQVLGTCAELRNRERKYTNTFFLYFVSTAQGDEKWRNCFFFFVGNIWTNGKSDRMFVFSCRLFLLPQALKLWLVTMGLRCVMWLG